MALIRYKDLAKMNDKEMEDKLKDLKLELVKANVTSNKANAKTKELKRAISRILTMNTLNKSKSLLKNK